MTSRRIAAPGVTKETELDTLLMRAFENFGHYIEAINTDATRYVHRTVRLFKGASPPPRHELCLERFEEVADPFVFVTQFSGDDGKLGRPAVASAPFISLLVGSYGTGKTELVFRMCEFLHQMPRSLKAPRPLPISLARCRSKRQVLDRPPSASYFTELLESGLPPEFARVANRQELRDQIRRGEILLILDALDELTEKDKRHRHFMAGLRQYLVDGAKAGADKNFRVVVTMRREYLSSVDSPTARETLQQLTGGESHHHVYLMEVNPYTDFEIRDYLMRRLDDGGQYFEKLEKTPKLLAPLHRPLLLKLFADVLEDSGPDYDWKSLLKKSKVAKRYEPGHLIEHYVNHVHEQGRIGQEVMGTAYFWDKDKLSRVSVDLFERGGSEFNADDVEKFRVLRRKGQGGPIDSKEDVREEDVFACVHKCPFLIQHENTVRFAHRAFLEFFTSKGIADEVRQVGVEKADAFNRLVVNSDMRKFLQYFLPKFYELIKVSCGLTTPRGWGITKAQYEEMLPALDAALRDLTEGMTYPELDSRKVESKIEWFLKNCDPTKFLPGYLIYCYHAIATYIQERPWRDGDERWRERLGPLLTQSFDYAEKKTKQRDGKSVDGWERLIERVLYIGHKLRYEWAKLKAETKDGWLDSSWDKKTHQRIDRIIEVIRETPF